MIGYFVCNHSRFFCLIINDRFFWLCDYKRLFCLCDCSRYFVCVIMVVSFCYVFHSL